MHVTDTFGLVYFGVIRKDAATTSLLPKSRKKQDLFLMDELLRKSKKLTGFSHLMWWFPSEIQPVIELLFKNKPLDQDVSGLLTLIMFAGIGSNEDVYFRDEIVASVFLSAPKNPWYDSQQNLSSFLFGITLDDVRKLSMIRTILTLLTNFYICRVPGF